MRKFIILMSAVLAIASAVACTSCDNDSPWGVEYALNSDGKTDAAVSVTFINGEFSIDGDANYHFSWTNAASFEKLFLTKDAKLLSEALNSKDATTHKAAD